MAKSRSFGRKLLSLTGQSAVILLTTFLLFEVSFRLYIIDFYGGDFEYLNSNFEQQEGRRDVLVIGDSFSAHKRGYVQLISDSLSDFNVRNASISGTSIREQFLFGRRHIKKQDPDILVFQFYTGNDLFSWSHPAEMKGISSPREVYWKLSEYLWSLSFINYSLAALKTNDTSQGERAEFVSHAFAPEKYTMRDKIYFKAEPGLVENAAMLTEGRAGDLKSYMKRMEKLFGFAGENSEIFIVIIPHCAQVNDLYLERMKLIGAQFSEDFKPGLASYPLQAEMEDFFSRDKRVRILDPLLNLKTMEENGRSVYFNNDSHLNTFGQRLIGKWLLKEINQDQVLVRD
ncbi:MAG: SGNH/GDSL hydrolase family protein [Roseivirga sp.]|nr:SGNH/GDSL hydrolase family protein [Roseivirga sp.]